MTAVCVAAVGGSMWGYAWGARWANRKDRTMCAIFGGALISAAGWIAV